jgi:hypothetical protein
VRGGPPGPPGLKNNKTQYPAGAWPPWGNLSIYQAAPLHFPLGSPFAGRGAAAVNLRAVDLPFLGGGEGLGRISGCRCFRRSRPDRRWPTPPRVDSLMPAASGVSSARSCARGLGLSRKPDASRQPSSNANVISNPLCKGSDIRSIWEN